MKRILLVFAALIAFAPAVAHDLWIEPDDFRPAPGADITARLLVGQDLKGDALPRNPAYVDRFILRDANGERPVGGEPGDDPAGTVSVIEPGLQWIGYQSHPVPLTLEAARFEAYLKDEGLERIVEQRAKTGRSAEPGRERFGRCAKSLLDARSGGAGSAASRAATGVRPEVPLGFVFELVPLDDPRALVPGGALRVAALSLGRPEPGVLVVAINRDDPGRRVSARTDARGRVKLALPSPGFWLVKAVRMQAAPAGAGVDWESWWASITFDLAPADAR